jgi:hypothetical protein
MHSEYYMRGAKQTWLKGINYVLTYYRGVESLLLRHSIFKYRPYLSWLLIGVSWLSVFFRNTFRSAITGTAVNVTCGSVVDQMVFKTF